MVLARSRLSDSLCERGGKNMYYYNYVIKSKRDDFLYSGFTSDIKKRLVMHNSGKVTATQCHKPFDLIYFEGCKSKKKAIEREKILKTGWGRKYLKGRI